MITIIKTVKYIYAFIKRIARWLENHRIRVYASQASFFIIISAIPMMIIILSFSGLILPEKNDLDEVLLSRIPPELYSVGRRVLDEIDEKSNLSLVSVSALTLLWAASRGVRGIGDGIRNVYGGEKDRYYAIYILKSLLMTFLYVCSVILALTVWVFGDSILKHASAGSPIGFLKVLNGGALFLLLSAVFNLSYRFFSGKREGLREAPGAFFSALCWFLFSELFEYYVSNFAKYSYVYGSLSTVIVVMLWLYFCMEILLVGAGVNVLLSKKVRTIKR